MSVLHGYTSSARKSNSDLNPFSISLGLTLAPMQLLESQKEKPANNSRALLTS